MIKTITNQAIALAGLSQAVWLVQQIAQRGIADQEAMEASIISTLKVDSDNVLDVYGGLSRLGAGLRQLTQQLGEPSQVDSEQARYASSLMFLERRLIKQPEMVEVVGAGVHQAAEQANKNGVLHENVFEVLAKTYTTTISRIPPRILVSGQPIYLSDTDNANRIRALLLAGIRSSVLWRQCGGARWKLLFYRTRLWHETQRLLHSFS